LFKTHALGFEIGNRSAEVRAFKEQLRTRR
jgi:hypothetical protein